MKAQEEIHTTRAGLWRCIFRRKELETKANLRDHFFLERGKIDGRVNKAMPAQWCNWSVREKKDEIQ